MTSFTRRAFLGSAAAGLAAPGILAQQPRPPMDLHLLPRIVPGRRSPIATLAASMAPDSWLDLTDQVSGEENWAVAPDTLAAFIGNFSNKMAFDPVTETGYFRGTTDPAGAPGRGYLKWDAVAMRFSLLEYPSWAGTDVKHGYDSVCIDASSRTLFMGAYPGQLFHSANLDADPTEWTRLPDVPDVGTQNTPHMDFFPEINAVVATHTFLFSPSRKAVARYHVASGEWEDGWIDTGIEGSMLHQFTCYVDNPGGEGVIIHGGGDNHTQDWYRIQVDGTFARIAPPPEGMRVAGGSDGGICCGSNRRLYAYNGLGNHWMYDILSDRWTKISSALTGAAWNKMSFPMRYYGSGGVIGYCERIGGPTHKFWIYNPPA